MAEIDGLLKKLMELEASDLHLTSGRKPAFRVHGEMLTPPSAPDIEADRMARLLKEITPEVNQKQFAEENDSDFAYELPGLARFRVNLFRDHRGPGAVLRVIPAEVLTADQLGLPAAVRDLCYLSKGLVLVTGPTGSGKSTTLAAMVDLINKSRSDHIITIEDPIEFVHRDQKCLVNQREVGKHTGSFKRALRAALREDPDIVLVGEMRDLETIEIAIETAETGHLVFGTLHTTTAPSTVDRIIDQFPADRQSQVRQMLAGSLKGVVAQTLCKRQPKGRIAALEILVATKAIAALIREGKTHQIPSAMQTGAKHGMKLLNDALLTLVEEGIVLPEEAYIKSVDKQMLKEEYERRGIKFDLAATATPTPAAAPPAPVAPRPAAAAPGPAPLAPQQAQQAQPPAPMPGAAPGSAAPGSGGQVDGGQGGGGQGGDGYADPFEQFKQQRR